MQYPLLRSLLIFVVLAAGACGGYAQTPPATQPEHLSHAQDETLRQELLRMLDADQAARAPIQGRWLNEAEQQQVMALDAAHTKRLREIFKAHGGFPGVALVGRDGAQAAFVMMIHSSALDLQKQALSYFKRAARRGEVPAEAFASLTDTILRNEGKPQLYGTKFDVVGGKFKLAPTKDFAHIDARRAKLGLAPLADYARGMTETYKMPVDATPPPR